jgi:hypothetical protein
MLNDTRRPVQLNPSGGVTVQTDRIRPGTKFKIELRNSVECYAYVFGQETDGSSYVLFPYTELHSPYCGIVGQRLFPRDYSLKPDNNGTTDYFAILLTQNELDFKRLNEQITRGGQGSYEANIRSALAANNLPVVNVPYRGGNSVQFSVPASERNKALLVMFAVAK